MNPDEHLLEALKQSKIAMDSDIADDYAESIIENAADNLDRARRRLQRRRLELEGPQGVSADGD